MGGGGGGEGKGEVKGEGQRRLGSGGALLRTLSRPRS